MGILQPLELKGSGFLISQAIDIFEMEAVCKSKITSIKL